MPQDYQLPVTLVIKEERLAIAEPTSTLMHLVETLAGDIEEETSKTRETPISKLKRREATKEIKTEVINSYMNTIRANTPLSQIFHPHNIQGWRVPEILVFKRGGFDIPANTVAIAIPLSMNRCPTIIYHENELEHISYPINWRIGSVVYMAGGASVRSDGDGVTAFAMLLLDMR